MLSLLSLRDAIGRSVGIPIMEQMRARKRWMSGRVVRWSNSSVNNLIFRSEMSARDRYEREVNGLRSVLESIMEFVTRRRQRAAATSSSSSWMAKAGAAKKSTPISFTRL